MYRFTTNRTWQHYSHPTAAQVETLIDVLERKPDLAKGFSKNQSGKQAANREWNRITLKLNSMGGTVKTAKKWIKYWSDKKSAVKKKAATRTASRNATGGGMVEDLPELSVIEERIIALMGGERFATGNRHVQIPPFDVQSQEHESPSILPPVAQTTSTCSNIMPETEDINVSEVPGTSEQINTPDIDFSLGHRHQSQLMENLEPDTAAAITTPTRPNQHLATENITERNRQLTSDSSQRPQYVPEPVAAGPPSSAHSTPRRRRRRILQATRNAQAAPPSQRQTNLSIMAERFLHLEQQRLELDSRMVALMERNSNREHLLTEAVRAMAEGLKAVAEAIKR